MAWRVAYRQRILCVKHASFHKGALQHCTKPVLRDCFTGTFQTIMMVGVALKSLVAGWRTALMINTISFLLISTLLWCKHGTMAIGRSEFPEISILGPIVPFMNRGSLQAHTGKYGFRTDGWNTFLGSGYILSSNIGGVLDEGVKKTTNNSNFNLLWYCTWNFRDSEKSPMRSRHNIPHYFGGGWKFLACVYGLCIGMSKVVGVPLIPFLAFCCAVVGYTGKKLSKYTWWYLWGRKLCQWHPM